MKLIQKNYILPFMYIFLLVGINNSVYSSDILKQFVIKSDPNQKFFVGVIGVIEEKKKMLDEFLKEQAELNSTYKIISEKITRHLNEVKTFSVKVEDELQQNPEDDSLVKQQLLLKESEQVLKDSQRTLDDTLV